MRVKELVHELQALEGLGSGGIREQYTSDVCDMLVNGMSDSPTVLDMIARPDIERYADVPAAIGNIDLLKGLVKSEEEIIERCSGSIVKNALYAAVVMGRCEIVAWMLEYIQDCQERQLPEPASLGRIHHLDESLSLATLMRQTDTDNMLLDVVTTNQNLSLTRDHGKATPDALHSCFYTGNTELF
ncbi:hypothetical protein CFE70_009358 [Pyrenophora teres f. teres 0-1]